MRPAIKSVKPLVLVLATLSGIAAASAIALGVQAQFSSGVGTSKAALTSGLKGTAQLTPECDMEPSQATAVIGVLANPSDAPATIGGLRVRPLLLAPDKAQPLLNAREYVLIEGPIDLAQAEARADAAGHNGSFSMVGVVPLRSQDPSLRSCNYQLDDKPAAKALVAPVAQAIVDQRFATASVLNSPSTTWAVTDDPFDASELIVTVGVPGAAEAPRVAGAPTTYSIQAITAFVEKATGRVLTVGFSPIYDESAQR